MPFGEDAGEDAGEGAGEDTGAGADLEAGEDVVMVAGTEINSMTPEVGEAGGRERRRSYDDGCVQGQSSTSPIAGLCLLLLMLGLARRRVCHHSKYLSRHHL